MAIQRREAVGIDSKTGHCPEVEGKDSLIYGAGFAAIKRVNGVEAELVMAFRIAADEFDPISNGGRLAETVGLEPTDEDHGTVREHVLKGNMFAGEIIPGKIGFFDEEDFVFVPARDLDAKTIGAEKNFRSRHGHLYKKESRF